MTDGRMGADLLGKPVYEATGQSGTFTTGQLIAVIGDFAATSRSSTGSGSRSRVIPHIFGASQGNLPTGSAACSPTGGSARRCCHANAFRTLKLA